MAQAIGLGPEAARDFKQNVGNRLLTHIVFIEQRSNLMAVERCIDVTNWNNLSGATLLFYEDVLSHEQTVQLLEKFTESGLADILKLRNNLLLECAKPAAAKEPATKPESPPQTQEPPVVIQEVVVLRDGAPPTPREIRLARTRTAYLEANGCVSAAMTALQKQGHGIGQSTFYEHLEIWDRRDPFWRSGVLTSSGASGNPKHSERVGLTKKRRRNRR